jgi:xylulokinase
VGNTWAVDLLDDMVGPTDWIDRLPTVLGPTEPAGPLGADGVAGLDIGTVELIGPGTGDNMAAALGVGLTAGQACISIGTSGTVYARSDRPVADASGIVAGFADATGGYLPLACTLNATRVTGAVAGLLGVDPRGLDDLALAAPAGARGLTLLPYFDGERTPDRPTATGILAGLRSGVRREDLARAAVEGVVCGLLDALDVLSGLVETDNAPLLLVGGGARSSAFRRVLADLSGRTVQVPDIDEAVATGACVQAAAVLLGRPLDDVRAAWGLGGGTFVEPDPHVDATAVRQAYAAVRG